MKNRINKRIKLLRTEAEISQITMAEKLDMTINQYSRLEKNGKITCDTAKKISELLNINILKIIYNDIELHELQKKSWFIQMIDNYTAPYIFIREDNKFADKYYESLNNQTNNK